MKKMFQRFNLIEIILAMAVIAIGMVGVMAMLTPSLNANRNAVGDTIAAEAALKMMSYIDYKSGNVSTSATDAAWYTTMTGLFGSGSAGMGNVSSYGSSGLLGGTSATDPFERIRRDASASNRFVCLDENDEPVVVISVSTGTSIPDVYSVSSADTDSVKDTETVTSNFSQYKRPGIRYYITVGWPVTVNDETDRQTRTFVHEIVRPHDASH